MMSSKSEIISLTPLNEELFTNDEGEFPTFVTLITAVAPTEVVTRVIGRMHALFVEYHAENNIPTGLSIQQAEVIKDNDNNTHTLLTPDTLAMILDYDASQRLIILELGTSPTDFTIH